MVRSKTISVIDMAIRLSPVLLMLGVTHARCVGIRTERIYGKRKDMNQTNGSLVLTCVITMTILH